MTYKGGSYSTLQKCLLEEWGMFYLCYLRVPTTLPKEVYMLSHLHFTDKEADLSNY